LISKSKIPPQVGGAGGQVREAVGDDIELFGFHGGWLQKNGYFTADGLLLGMDMAAY
jgi:hypothetical protein